MYLVGSAFYVEQIARRKSESRTQDIHTKLLLQKYLTMVLQRPWKLASRTIRTRHSLRRTTRRSRAFNVGVVGRVKRRWRRARAFRRPRGHGRRVGDAPSQLGAYVDADEIKGPRSARVA